MTYDDNRVCRKAEPISGLKCGLYAWHRQMGTPHRILRVDYPFRQSFERIEWDDTARWVRKQSGPRSEFVYFVDEVRVGP